MKAFEPSSQPAVSAVIVNFNSGPLIVRAVESVLASGLATEVIVSDNGSTDGSLERVAALAAADARVRVLRNGGNLGFARANNLAFAACAGDFLLVLNPDCVLQPGALATVVGVLRDHPEAGMAGCLIENPDGSEQAGCRRTLPTPFASLAFFTRVDRFLPWIAAPKQVNLNREPLPSAPAAVEAISGAFMLIRRQALEEVGGFDEAYFLHCEDLDWCARFGQRGWQILFVPTARAVHFKGTSSQDRPVFVLWHKHRGMARFFRKFQSQRHSLPFNGLVMVGIWGRFALLAGAALLMRLR